MLPLGIENATLCSGFIKAEKPFGHICSFFCVWFWVVTPYCQHYSFLFLGRAVIVLGLVNTKALKKYEADPSSVPLWRLQCCRMQKGGKQQEITANNSTWGQSVFQMTLIEVTYNDNCVCGEAYLQKKMLALSYHPFTCCKCAVG